MKKMITLLLVAVLPLAFTVVSPAQEAPGTKKKVEPKEIILSHQDLQLTEEAKQLYDFYFKIAIPKASVEKQNRLQHAQALLLQASALASDEGLKNYLQVLSEDLGKKDFTSSSALWMGLNERSLDFFIKYRRKQRRLDPYIVYYDNEASKALVPLRNVADQMLNELSVKREYIDNLGRLMAPIQVARLLYAPSVRRFVLMAPSEPVKQKRPGFKLLVFRNVSDAYFKDVLKPVAKELLVGAWAGAIDEEAFLRYVVLQKICHYVGPVLVPDKTDDKVQTVSAALGKILPSLEIIKSHVLAARCVPLLVKEKIIPQEDEKKLLAMYVTYLADKLRHGPERKANLPYLAQFNLLMQQGGIAYDIQKKRFYIDIPGMKKALTKISLDVLELIQKGKAKAVKKFFDRSQEVPSELEDIMATLSGMPLQIKMVTPEPSN